MIPITGQDTSMDIDVDIGPVSNENFELWIRMATDNKINIENSWNFALIDYFHDFSVLKSNDGNSVDFQKASTTLDGCMKIYSHRVDSAVKDTSTLLSTLNIQSKKSINSANKNNNHNNNNINSTTDNRNDNDNEDGDGDEEDDNEEDIADDPDHEGRPRSRKVKKSKFLASSFNSIKVKDDFFLATTDPVFKNALADFDEGGAKSLLNNILRVSNEGKVVFDIAHEDKPTVGLTNLSEENVLQGDLFENLKSKITNFDFSNNSLKVCPSLAELDNISKGLKDASSLIQKLENVDVTMVENEIINQHYFLNPQYNANLQSDSQIPPLNDNPFLEHINDHDQPDFEFDAYANTNNDDIIQDNVSNTSKRTQYSLFMDGVENSDDSQYNFTLGNVFGDEQDDNDNTIRIRKNLPLLNKKPNDVFAQNRLDEVEMDYINKYDDIGSRPDVYWKITRLKRNAKLMKALSTNDDGDDDGDENDSDATKSSKKSKTKKYKPARTDTHKLIDFMSDGDMKDDDFDLDEDIPLFESSDYLSQIMLSEKERNSGKHVLDGDLKFSAKLLAFLSLKPNQLTMNSVLLPNRLRTYEEKEKENIPAGPEYFAETYKNDNPQTNTTNNTTHENSILHDINNDDLPVFEDFDPNGIEGFDAPLNNDDNTDTPTDFRTQSQFTQRSNKGGLINYAKRSKRVDVKLLKQNIWTSIEEISISKKKRSASHFNEDNETQNENEKDNKDEAESNNTNTPTKTLINSDNILDNNNDLENKDTMKFTKVVEIMSTKYNENIKKDLSTSFCFICLLHLANEQGLTLEMENDYEDIIIHK